MPTFNRQVCYRLGMTKSSHPVLKCDDHLIHMFLEPAQGSRGEGWIQQFPSLVVKSHIPGSEGDRANLEEGIVKRSLFEARFVSVDLLHGGSVIDRYVIRRNAHEFTVLFVLLGDLNRTMEASTLQCKPKWRHFGPKWSWESPERRK